MFPVQKAQVEQKLQDPQLYRRTKPGVNGISYEPEKMLEECRDKFLRLRKGVRCHFGGQWKRDYYLYLPIVEKFNFLAKHFFSNLAF